MFSRIRPWRRTVQCLTALAFVGIPVINMHGFSGISGNFLSFSMGGIILADPLAVLQVLAGEGKVISPAVIGAGIVLVLACICGRVFCSWLCPYGLFSEWIFALRGEKEYPVSPIAPTVVRIVVMFIGIAAVVFFLSGPVVSQLSMPGWYSRAMQHFAFYGVMLYGSLIFPIFLVLEGGIRQRFWCRYICPQSVLLSLSAAFSRGLRLRFSPSLCTCPKNDRPCHAACSLGVNPRIPGLNQRLECTNCGDCVDVCRSRGEALSLKLQ